MLPRANSPASRIETSTPNQRQKRPHNVDEEEEIALHFVAYTLHNEIVAKR